MAKRRASGDAPGIPVFGPMDGPFRSRTRLGSAPPPDAAGRGGRAARVGGVRPAGLRVRGHAFQEGAADAPVGAARPVARRQAALARASSERSISADISCISRAAGREPRAAATRSQT